MDSRTEIMLNLTRRRLLGQGINAGSLAFLAGLGGSQSTAAQKMRQGLTGGLPDVPHHLPTAKRFIYLFMSGGPAQHETGPKTI